MKEVLLRGGLLDGRRVEVEDDASEVRWPYARQVDPLALDKIGPPSGERIGGVVIVEVYFDSGYIRSPILIEFQSQEEYHARPTRNPSRDLQLRVRSRIQ